MSDTAFDYDDQLNAIVSFERTLFTAQAFDSIAGALDDGVNGGPVESVARACRLRREPAAGRGPQERADLIAFLESL